jgi:hypothetical protein
MKVSTTRSLLVLFLCSLVIAGAATSHAATAALIHKRCAFDLGSGETKGSAGEVSFTEPSFGIARLMPKNPAAIC